MLDLTNFCLGGQQFQSSFRPLPSPHSLHFTPALPLPFIFQPSLTLNLLSYSVAHCYCTIFTPQLHCVSKKFPPLNSLWLCQILTNFQNFCTAGKRTKFATKPIWQHPPHLRHAVTLPWEIKNSNFFWDTVFLRQTIFRQTSWRNFTKFTNTNVVHLCRGYMWITSVFYFTCNHIWNWNRIISATNIISKLFRRHWTCWKYSRPTTYTSKIILGKFPCADYFCQTSTKAEMILK